MTCQIQSSSGVLTFILSNKDLIECSLKTKNAYSVRYVLRGNMMSVKCVRNFISYHEDVLFSV